MKFSTQIDRLKSIGLFMMLLFLIPVTTLEGKFKLPSDTNVYYLLGSPSHRIYLATVGMSFFAGSILTGLAKKKRFAIVLILLLLMFNIYKVRQREVLWESGTAEIKDSVSKLMKLKPSIPEHSTLLFINFPLSTGFFKPFIKVYYNLEDVKVG